MEVYSAGPGGMRLRELPVLEDLLEEQLRSHPCINSPPTILLLSHPRLHPRSRVHPHPSPCITELPLLVSLCTSASLSSASICRNCLFLICLISKSFFYGHIIGIIERVCVPGRLFSSCPGFASWSFFNCCFSTHPILISSDVSVTIQRHQSIVSCRGIPTLASNVASHSLIL